MKSMLLAFVLFPLAMFAQQSAAVYPHQWKADSMVAYFLGNEVFRRYVKLDTKESKYSGLDFFVQYKFQHPAFEGETFVISFTLNSAGQFVPNSDTRGIVRIQSSDDATWIKRRQALSISRDQAHRIKARSLRLAWDSTNVSYKIFQQTKDFRDIVPGAIVWKVDGVVKFRGDKYSGTFEVDMLTGTVTRRFAIPWD